jgi:hypothetical protein
MKHTAYDVWKSIFWKVHNGYKSENFRRKYLGSQYVYIINIKNGLK